MVYTYEFLLTFSVFDRREVENKTIFNTHYIIADLITINFSLPISSIEFKIPPRPSIDFLAPPNGIQSTLKAVYIVQHAAIGKEEFEVYYLHSPEKSQEYGVFSINWVRNRSTIPHPINSIHNPETTYLDITYNFSEKEKRDLWNHLNSVGNFRMARVCTKANLP